MAEKKIKADYLAAALATDFEVSKEVVKNVEWEESAGAGVMDGFTTEVVAAKGQAEIAGKKVEFSYIVKLTPNIGYRVDMVKEVSDYKRLDSLLKPKNIFRWESWKRNTYFTWKS